MPQPSKTRISPGLSFAAGTLAGAIAVFVPLNSAGHPGPKVESSPPSLGAVRSSDRPPAPKAVGGSSPAKKQESKDSNVPSNRDTCDVQLD